MPARRFRGRKSKWDLMSSASVLEKVVRREFDPTNGIQLTYLFSTHGKMKNMKLLFSPVPIR